MIISQSAEYALRAAVLLSRAEGAPMTAQQLAESSRIPPDYLSKILQALRKAGIVTSQRGVNGGFVLAKEPRRTTVLEVVNALDPIERILSCPLKLTEHGTKLCPLHRKLDDAIATVEKAFGGTSLAQLSPADIPGADVCRQLVPADSPAPGRATKARKSAKVGP
ncbi:HTH-type transcriptional regulator CymR [mine drainage metagenome]|uniref:HTH-type transcriptional regulator CymR n=1 Tax=mine drainage metagenome TaxID=410659 RepID=A0A1J5SN82_9ZZZZ